MKTSFDQVLPPRTGTNILPQRPMQSSAPATSLGGYANYYSGRAPTNRGMAQRTPYAMPDGFGNQRGKTMQLRSPMGKMPDWFNKGFGLTGVGQASPPTMQPQMQGPQPLTDEQMRQQMEMMGQQRFLQFQSQQPITASLATQNQLGQYGQQGMGMGGYSGYQGFPFGQQGMYGQQGRQSMNPYLPG